ncbi:MAG: MraY family glycosyltransferase [Patescibacteria group bacterium]
MLNSNLGKKVLEIPLIKERGMLSILGLNVVLGLIGVWYAWFRFVSINPLIPFWYTKPWGSYQLDQSAMIFLIPVAILSLTFSTIPFLNLLLRERNKDASITTLSFLSVASFFLFISEIRIIAKASSAFHPLLEGGIKELFPLAIVSFALCFMLVPLVIKMAKSYGLVTDPNIHIHPGMILKKPSARAGGVAFYLAFILVALVAIPFNRETAGLFIGTLATTLLGLWDDKKNISPYLRLILLALIVILVLIISDLHIYFFANPVDGITRLDMFKIPISLFTLKFTILPIADIVTVLWVLWIMNMLSWSNAVDGQFSGMTAITCTIVAVLSLRLLKIDPEQIHTARIAAIAAGASLGILPYNWHPSKIMWGFGATTMGFLIAITSIMAGTKVAAATFVLIVPTLDALITIARRLLQGKSPVWGDRGHLHHRLLDLGFTQPQVSVLYWVLTLVFGGIALISSGRSKFLALLTIGGIVSFILVVMNLKGEVGKPNRRQPVKALPKADQL